MHWENRLSEQQNTSLSKSQNLQPKTSSKNITSEKTFLNQFTDNLIGNDENSENYFTNIFTRNTNIFKDLDISNSENIPDIIKSLIPIKNNTEKNKSSVIIIMMGKKILVICKNKYICYIKWNHQVEPSIQDPHTVQDLRSRLVL